MLIDIHTHILPGMDDGAAGEAMSFQMLRDAYKTGSTLLVATPHYHCSARSDWEEKRRTAYELVCDMAQQISPDFHILLGAEVFYESALLEQLKHGKDLALHHTRAILIEFSPDVNYLYIKNAVLALQSMGYVPVLAHIERYAALMRMDRVEELSDMGAKLQVNASSVMGKHGWKIKRYLMQLMRNGWIDLVATDAHNVTDRPIGMADCAKYLTRKLGADDCRSVCHDNAWALLMQQSLTKT